VEVLPEGAIERKGKESNTDRLRYILDEPPLKSLFLEFLRGNSSENNLSFWLDVQDFKRDFDITSSAATVNHQVATEHHESLIHTALQIYNKYLAPSSQCELDIDHGLRKDLVKYLEHVITNLMGTALQGRVAPEQANAFNATQLQMMIGFYDRIQGHVFRLMAIDSVPKVGLFSFFVLVA